VKEDAAAGGGGKTTWTKFLPFLDEGIVDWADVLKQLRGAGYGGPLVYHAEVDTHRSAETVGEAAERDLAYLRRLLAAKSALVH
jgi:sugar phosphate isomerase/epimerase